MKTRMIFSGNLLILVLCAIVIPARAQTASSQQTLDQYVADLQKNPDDTALREKIIKLVQEMKPAPAIPEEAREHYVMATTFAQKAKDDTEKAKGESELRQANSGFEHAIEQYKAALVAAPWWADAYKKQALAQEAADRYDDAIASLNLYLLTQPADARDAQDEIYKVKALKQSAEEDKELAAKEAEAKARESSPEAIAARKQAEFDAFLAKIDGRRYTWQRGHGVGPLAIDVRGRFLVTGQIDTRMANGEFHPGFEKWGPDPVAIQGFETTVPLPNPGYAPGIAYHTEATFIISEDGYSVTWRTRFSDGNTNDMVFLWQR